MIPTNTQPGTRVYAGVAEALLVAVDSDDVIVTYDFDADLSSGYRGDPATGEITAVATGKTHLVSAVPAPFVEIA